MTTRPYSETLADALQTPEDIAEYLDAAYLYEGKAGFLLALRDVAELRGISAIAEETGLGRESLYKTLSENGNPKLSTMRTLLGAVKVRITFTPDDSSRTKLQGAEGSNQNNLAKKNPHANASG